MKQTAVEWLLEKISLKKFDDETYLMPTILNEEIEQAKEMEKQQIINAWIVEDNELQRTEAEKYYNLSYKKD
jgi:hypothetical protein